MGAGGTYYFAQAYFFCPSYGAGSRQVHKIDTGDEEDEDGHAAEYTHILNPTIYRPAVDKDAVQVLVTERLEACLQGDALFLRTQLRLYVPVDLGLCSLGVGGCGQLNV